MSFVIWIGLSYEGWGRYDDDSMSARDKMLGRFLLMPHLIVVKMLCVIWIGEEDFAEKKEKGNH